MVEFSVSHMIRKAKNPNPPQTDLSICLFLSILLSSDPKLIIAPWCPTTSQTNPFHYTSLFLCLSVFLFCTVTIGTVVSATSIISTKNLFLFLYYLCFFIVFLFLYFLIHRNNVKKKKTLIRSVKMSFLQSHYNDGIELAIIMSIWVHTA